MKSKPLVSVIIVSYKNYHYIYQAIDSVLSQDYDNIELIINNDGSSDFKKSLIISYLKKKIGKNIKNIIVNNNIINLGTVKNINNALKLATGEYILIFAADDTFYDNKVISKFITAFNSLDKNEYIVTSQLGMYDLDLKELTELFVSETTKEKIHNLSPTKLFSEMATQCIIPGSSTCYKKVIFEKYGLFDEKYLLVEDYSSSLKFSRLGIKYNYFDFISFKHRDGGISHGNVIGDHKTNSKYELDILNIMKYEVMPYKNLLEKKQLKIFNYLYQERYWQYYFKHQFKEGDLLDKLLFIIKNFHLISYKLFRKIYTHTKNKLYFMFIIGLIMSLNYVLHTQNYIILIKTFGITEPQKFLNLTYYLNGLIGIILIITSIAIKFIPLIKKYKINI